MHSLYETGAPHLRRFFCLCLPRKSKDDDSLAGVRVSLGLEVRGEHLNDEKNELRIWSPGF